MFKKIEISNVGRFKSASLNGDNEFFTKNTFIYGKNTFGKSTITAIFRSLKENNPDYIIGRRTIGTQKQTLKITPEFTTPTGEYRYITGMKEWNVTYPEIMIFDGNFVRENIYTHTQHIGKDQQKNIETFMLGSKGIEFNKSISALDDKISKNIQDQARIKNEYNISRGLLGGLDFKEFLMLPEDKDCEDKITTVRKELDSVNNSEIITAKLKSIISMLDKYTKYDTSSITVGISVDNSLIEEHFVRHLDTGKGKQNYTSFLQAGNVLRKPSKDERCPFCTQKIVEDNAEVFLSTINKIYNDKYRNLQQALGVALTIFSKDIFLTGLNESLSDLVRVGYTLHFDTSLMVNSLVDCEDFIKEKKEDFSKTLNETCFSKASSYSEGLVSQVKSELARFIDPSLKKDRITEKLKKLIASKERQTSWMEPCSKYTEAKSRNVVLSKERHDLWARYSEYGSSLSEAMLKDVNDILVACNCCFAIQELGFKGNKREEMFRLVIDEYPISNEGKDDEMTIKNTLSDSDKSILALAFFLATVKNNPAIQLVVMDDPITSFDSDRRKVILREIKRILSTTTKQLILLTHDKHFYRLVHSEYRSENTSSFLRISVNIDGYSSIISCNPEIDYDFMSEYNAWVIELKEACGSQNIHLVKSAHSNIRLVIEYILKMKYCVEISPEIVTLGKILDKLEDPGGSYSLISQRKSVEELLPNLVHHDHSGTRQYPIDSLGIEDYRNDIKNLFKVIKTL